jgi:hypothetical protein
VYQFARCLQRHIIFVQEPYDLRLYTVYREASLNQGIKLAWMSPFPSPGGQNPDTPSGLGFAWVWWFPGSAGLLWRVCMVSVALRFRGAAMADSLGSVSLHCAVGRPWRFRLGFGGSARRDPLESVAPRCSAAGRPWRVGLGLVALQLCSSRCGRGWAVCPEPGRGRWKGLSASRVKRKTKHNM